MELWGMEKQWRLRDDVHLLLAPMIHSENSQDNCRSCQRLPIMTKIMLSRRRSHQYSLLCHNSLGFQKAQIVILGSKNKSRMRHTVTRLKICLRSAKICTNLKIYLNSQAEKILCNSSNHSKYNTLSSLSWIRVRALQIVCVAEKTFSESILNWLRRRARSHIITRKKRRHHHLISYPSSCKSRLQSSSVAAVYPASHILSQCHFLIT